ncbi:MAG: NUDIX domain-containing protein [Brevefilum sp.]|nr:NUDIX domain-containing protein [Brevefilum sp.]
MKQLLYWLWRNLPLTKSMRSCLMWLFNTKFVVGTSILIQNDTGEILLFKHSYRKNTPWGFPGGYVMRGENPDQAIQRELMEESGFEIKNLKLIEVFQSREMARMEMLFSGELEDDQVFAPSREVAEARFFSRDQLPELIPEHQAIVDRHLPAF